MPTPAALALAGGSFTARAFAPEPAEGGAAFEKTERRFSASRQGFDIHGAARIAEGDDEGHERLVRYCARPRRWKFMARLASLVPPPYFPLTRYHGVFAACPRLRLPRPPPIPPSSPGGTGAALQGGELYASASRLDWAVLLQRTHGLRRRASAPRATRAPRPLP